MIDRMSLIWVPKKVSATSATMTISGDDQRVLGEALPTAG